MSEDHLSGDPQSRNLEEFLHEQFRKMGTESPLPEELKKEVFDTLDALSFLSDLIDLFTIKFSQSELELLDHLNAQPPTPSDGTPP
ncbi:MAG: hypothetical protein D6765_17630, partial [Bacteroidetes bacterium]